MFQDFTKLGDCRLIDTPSIIVKLQVDKYKSKLSLYLGYEGQIGLLDHLICREDYVHCTTTLPAAIFVLAAGHLQRCCLADNQVVWRGRKQKIWSLHFPIWILEMYWNSNDCGWQETEVRGESTFVKYYVNNHKSESIKLCFHQKSDMFLGYQGGEWPLTKLIELCFNNMFIIEYKRCVAFG